jgi:hypothetical protein
MITEIFSDSNNDFIKVISPCGNFQRGDGAFAPAGTLVPVFRCDHFDHQLTV